jgi:hypothetical protein
MEVDIVNNKILSCGFGEAGQVSTAGEGKKSRLLSGLSDLEEVVQNFSSPWIGGRGLFHRAGQGRHTNCLVNKQKALKVISVNLATR